MPQRFSCVRASRLAVTEPEGEARTRVLVPVLTLRNASGSIDFGANRAYAERAAATWLDGFIISGTIGEGDLLTSDERQQLLAVWLDELPASRVLGCVWEPADLAPTVDSGARPLAVMRDLGTLADALAWLAELPRHAFVYSHPRYTARTYDPQVATAAERRGISPPGGKICKVSLAEVAALRAAANSDFQLYDGRCRHLARSLSAGATGVIAVPLCSLPTLKSASVPALQAAIDVGQSLLDGHLPRDDRLAALTRALAGRGD